MTVVVSCSCGKALRVPDGMRGQRGKCPGCGAVLAIPQDRPAAPDPRRADGQIVGSLCTVCQTPIERDTRVRECPKCRLWFHDECWAANGGCASYGCELAPKTVKVPLATLPTEAWGDEKTCPNCGRLIKSVALKCRYCHIRFPTAAPLTRQEYLAYAEGQPRLDGIRRGAVAVFIFSAIGLLAPVMLVISGLWVLSNRPLLAKIPGTHRVLAYVSVLLSAIYSLILLAVALSG